LKGVLKFTLKELQNVSVLSPSSGSAPYELAKVTMLKQSNVILAGSNSALPEDGD
jgi:hypothetical protein